MGRTGETDKKRRHVSSISPTAATATATATAKKQPFTPLSEEKKLDAVVLKFQNKKLKQKLETQKVEINALEDRFFQLQDQQRSHETTLIVVNSAWNELVDDLESRSRNYLNVVKHGHCSDGILVKQDCDSYPEDLLLSRLLEKEGATESSSSNLSEDVKSLGLAKETEGIFSNIVASFDDLNCLKHRLYVASLNAVSSHGQSLAVSSDLQNEAKNLSIAVFKLHLRHKSLAGELQRHRDTDAKNKADRMRLKGELEGTVAQLEENNRELTILYAERDAGKGAFFPALNRGNKQPVADKVKDKRRDVQDMESTLKELMEQSTSRLCELKRLHEERLGLLKHLSELQSNLKNVKFICSSRPYLLLRDQLTKARTDLVQYQALCEKLQVEKESLYWREKESHLKNELVDVLHRSSAVTASRISELEVEIQRYIKERNLIEAKLQEACKDPGRKEIIAEFKALVSSFPERMGNMQNQLAKHKKNAVDIHCLRAGVISLTNILDYKVKELETLAYRSAQQSSEIQGLHAVIRDLKSTEANLKHFLETYQYRSTDSRGVNEAKISELKAWAHVKGLQSSLDERNLELRVKVAIEAESKAQQRLAASEAEIMELRQKLESSKREKAGLTDILKSKHEETETYLSEIETIGQAYDDMQNQNQQLLQQVTEIDDYNVKLVLEGLHSKQMADSLLMEKRMLENSIQHAKKTVDFFDLKAGRIGDQLKSYSDYMRRLVEDRVQNTTALENMDRRFMDVRKSSQQVMTRLEETQSQVDQSRVYLAELQIELENERFSRRRLEEDLDPLRRKAQQLRFEAEGSSVTEKLRHELREYKEILECSVCHERRKEVVITKCYHLFCNTCIQKVIETRHRKCPVCAASFGANDVKAIYI